MIPHCVRAVKCLIFIISLIMHYCVISAWLCLSTSVLDCSRRKVMPVAVQYFHWSRCIDDLNVSILGFVGAKDDGGGGDRHAKLQSYRLPVG